MQKYLLISLQELQLRFTTATPLTQTPKTVYYAFMISSPNNSIKKFNHHLTDSNKYLSQNMGDIILQEFSIWKKQQNPHNTAKIIQIDNTIIIDISAQVEEYVNTGTQSILYIQRYQNNMPQMYFEISKITSELTSIDTTNKKIIKKRQQMKQGQIIAFQMTTLSGESQLLIHQKYMPSILQHYLLIDNFTIQNQQKQKNQRRAEKTDHQKYYSLVVYGKSSRQIPQEYCMAIQQKLHKNKLKQYQICIQIPNVFSFRQYTDGQIVAKSPKYKTQQLSDSQFHVNLEGSKANNLNMSLKWGINLEDIRPQHNLLTESHQILLYDIEVKFENYTEHSNTKIKIIYGNKAFQLTGQYNSPKPVKIKKFIHIRVKSEDQEILIGAEKSLKMVAQSRFYTDEIIAYTLNYPKRKLIDNSGKSIGYIKFKCQKSKQMSLPHNNTFWKQSLKKKYQHTLIIAISQISVNYVHDDPVQVVIKTDNQEKTVQNVPNIEYYNNQLQIYAQQNVINVKNDESVYMLVKSRQEKSQGDFIGINLLNFGQFLMGQNPVQMAFFKNQQKTITLNCIINKIPNYTFIKSVFQPQILASPHMKTITVSLFMKQISLSPYFYTFQYMKKTEIYGAFNVNRQKKVLILQSSNHNQLQLITSASSDNLNFIIQQTQFLVVKVIIFVADLGQDHQVYGTAVIKLRSSDITTHQKSKGKAINNNKLVNFNNIPIKNLYGVDVGKVSLQVYEGAMENSHRIDTHDILDSPRPKYSKDNKKLKQQIHHSVSSTNNIDNQASYMEHYFSNSKSNQINQSLEVKKTINHQNKVHRHQQQKMVKLPLIKQIVKPKKKQNYDEFLKMMQVRRRGAAGTYQDGNSLGSYQKNNNKDGPITQRRSRNRYKSTQTPTINDSSLMKIERQNPNLNRNLEILFPRKIQRRQQIKQQIDLYEQKLLGLKSVLNEISQDIEQIEPTINGEIGQRRSGGYNKNSRQLDYIAENKSKEQLFRQIQNIEIQQNQFMKL